MSGYWLNLRDTVAPDAFDPLVRFAEIVGADPALPPLDPDDFLYAARIERADRPDLHVYRNVFTRKCLIIDDGLGVWAFSGVTKANPEGYTALDTAAAALTRAEVARGNLLARHSRRYAAGVGAVALAEATASGD